MGLRLKFNLVLVVVTLLSLAGAGALSYSILQKNAKEEVLSMASIMLDSAVAVKGYTVSEVKPLLAVQQRRAFVAQSIPTYAATEYIRHLQKSHSDYSYKEAVLNPTNPANRPSEWEADIVQHFRNKQQEKEVIGTRETATGPQLYIGRPITITNEQCLACHDTPARAPKTLVDKYGPNNGFGWTHNETVGAQIVSVPMSLPLQRAQETFMAFMGSLVTVFIALAIVLNLMLHFIIINPVRAMSAKADEISMSDLNVEELSVSGSDEIASLGRSFNRMHRSLNNAVKLIDETNGFA